MLKDGWLDRQFEQVSKNVENWPAWMRRAAGFGAADECKQDENKHPDANGQHNLNLK